MENLLSTDSPSSSKSVVDDQQNHGQALGNNWANIGGSLPIKNPQAFCGGEIRLSKNIRPKLVVNVPLNEGEKRVKISRTSVILKYLKNNWIWHSKNGRENAQESASTSSRKRRLVDSLNEAENEANAARDRIRYQQFQALMRNISEEQQERAAIDGRVQQTEEDMALLRDQEEQGQVRRIRRDFLLRQIEQEDSENGDETTAQNGNEVAPGPSTSSSNLPSKQEMSEKLETGLEEQQKNGDKEILKKQSKSKQHQQSVKSIAERAAMEEDGLTDKKEEDNISVISSAGPSSSSAYCSSETTGIIRRRTLASTGGRHQRRTFLMDEDDEEEEKDREIGERRDDEDEREDPPAKRGRSK